MYRSGERVGLSFRALGAPFDVDWRTGLKFFPPNVLRPTGVEGVEDEEDPSITEEPIAPEHQGTEVLYLRTMRHHRTTMEPPT